MTVLRNLLEERGIRKAVVIDDVFDAVPRPDELNDADWTIFFDDLGETGHKRLAEIYPQYEATHSDDLRVSQEFISILWENRKSLPPGACDPLFSEYETTSTRERAGLDALVTALEGIGLTCATMGRELDEGANEADLIFVDLFLGRQQSENDMERAIRRVTELVSGREQKPPLVVLMSRSPRLWEKRNDFRDNAGLLGSTFRVVSKADLAKDGMLETMLTRLASHYEDAMRIARFVHTWDSGLDQARKNFLQILRRLDLPDLAQIRALLLDFEGQQLGEYLLDVADRVLQHEIEANSGTIAAAQELNKIKLSQYPAPHLAGSPDLQELAHRMVFQHVERLKLSSTGDIPQLQFGDILRCKDQDSGAATDHVLLIVTPACDLARCGTENILVLPGSLKPLSARDWSYGSTAAKTPIFTSSDGSRYWIRWNLKGRQTIPLKTLCELLYKGKGYERLGRIREMYAIEIQQKMLADMGRIGQPANPPATFPVAISLYVVSPDARPSPIEIPALTDAVCFVGRGEDPNRVDHLVLSEAACDALRSTIQKLQAQEVHTAAHQSLATMKADLGFFERFERGLINVPLKDNLLTPETGIDNLVYMHLVRNEWKNEGDPVRGNHRNGAIIMNIRDILPSVET
ncbi:hypothetical protein EVC37_16140 [Methylocaldum sp. BRCS4]|nr:hypothetical protein [Methylocaldum sp. BRCS4]